jgi:hypothetical protein
MKGLSVRKVKERLTGWLVLSFLAGTSSYLFAEDAGNSGAVFQQELDTVWVLIAAFLVFFMQAGFGWSKRLYSCQGNM